MNKSDENLIDKRINFNYDEIISEFTNNFKEIIIPAAAHKIQSLVSADNTSTNWT